MALNPDDNPIGHLEKAPSIPFIERTEIVTIGDWTFTIKVLTTSPAAHPPRHAHIKEAQVLSVVGPLTTIATFAVYTASAKRAVDEALSRALNGIG